MEFNKVKILNGKLSSIVLLGFFLKFCCNSFRSLFLAFLNFKALTALLFMSEHLEWPIKMLATW